MRFLRFALVVAFVATAAGLSIRLSARQAPYRSPDPRRPYRRRNGQPVVRGRRRDSRRSDRRGRPSRRRARGTGNRRAWIGRRTRLHRSAYALGSHAAQRWKRREQGPAGRDARRDRREHVGRAARRAAGSKEHVDGLHGLLACAQDQGHLDEPDLGGVLPADPARRGRLLPGRRRRPRSSHG